MFGLRKNEKEQSKGSIYDRGLNICLLVMAVSWLIVMFESFIEERIPLFTKDARSVFILAFSIIFSVAEIAFLCLFLFAKQLKSGKISLILFCVSFLWIIIGDIFSLFSIKLPSVAVYIFTALTAAAFICLFFLFDNDKKSEKAYMNSAWIMLFFSVFFSVINVQDEVSILMANILIMLTRFFVVFFLKKAKSNRKIFISET